MYLKKLVCKCKLPAQGECHAHDMDEHVLKCLTYKRGLKTTMHGNLCLGSIDSTTILDICAFILTSQIINGTFLKPTNSL
jgi:hypothetical protein